MNASPTGTRQELIRISAFGPISRKNRQCFSNSMRASKGISSGVTLIERTISRAIAFLSCSAAIWPNILHNTLAAGLLVERKPYGTTSKFTLLESVPLGVVTCKGSFAFSFDLNRHESRRVP